MGIDNGIDPRFWMLLSPALPVGGYSYSQGLEYAVQAGWVGDYAGAADWIGGVAESVLPRVDLPILARLHGALAAGEEAAVARWDACLAAHRESRELLCEDRRMGAALARLLDALDVDAAPLPARPSFATSFAAAALAWHIDVRRTLAGYAWVWCENQVAAAVKLVPLGQSQGQQLLLRLAARLDDIVGRALAAADNDIGQSLPGLALASALHETQYSRLFRS